MIESQLRPLYKFKMAGGRRRDSVVWWPLETSLVSKCFCLLNLPPPSLEWSASFSSLSMPSVYRSQSVKQQLAYQLGNGRSGSWERGIHGGNTELAFGVYVGKGGLYWDACVLLCEYRDSPKMLAGQMRFFEELHGVHCGKEGKLTAAQWAGLWYGRFCGHWCPNRGRSSD